MHYVYAKYSSCQNIIANLGKRDFFSEKDSKELAVIWKFSVFQQGSVQYGRPMMTESMLTMGLIVCLDPNSWKKQHCPVCEV